MEFIKKIREDLNLNSYKMAKKMGMKTTQHYIAFERSKRVISIENLVKLWELSGLSGQEFMELMREEVSQKQSKKAGE